MYIQPFSNYPTLLELEIAPLLPCDNVVPHRFVSITEVSDINIVDRTFTSVTADALSEELQRDQVKLPNPRNC